MVSRAMVRQIGAAVDRRARWDVQVRQAIEAWIAVAQSDLALTLSWIRDLPSLGADARHLQREWLEGFILLVPELTDSPERRRPPPRRGRGPGSPPPPALPPGPGGRAPPRPACA